MHASHAHHRDRPELGQAIRLLRGTRKIELEDIVGGPVGRLVARLLNQRVLVGCLGFSIEDGVVQHLIVVLLTAGDIVLLTGVARVASNAGRRRCGDGGQGHAIVHHLEHLVSKSRSCNVHGRVLAEDGVVRGLLAVARPRGKTRVRTMHGVELGDGADASSRIVAAVHAEAAVVQADGRDAGRDGEVGTWTRCGGGRVALPSGSRSWMHHC